MKQQQITEPMDTSEKNGKASWFRDYKHCTNETR